MVDNTFASSPLSSAPSSVPQIPTTLSQQISEWRSSRELPFEIQQHVRIYFEESLFARALDLLISIVASDASAANRQVTVPSSDHIALVSTLLVHPLQTTRTTSEEKWAEGNAALRLLRILLVTVGPITSKFSDAFKFRKLYNNDNDHDSEEDVKHSFANEDSLWNRADDLWAVIGWTFNCSSLPDMYAARWTYWKTWLEFMIDALEIDWKYNLSKDSPSESMLWKYISFSPSDLVHPRRILRAIFADGSKNSLNEFREIFKRELKGPKTESDKAEKREAVDIDKEIFGDYLRQDDSDSSSENEQRVNKRTSTRAASARRITPRTSRQSLRSDQDEDATSDLTLAPSLGPPDSIISRLRLMQLLVNVASQPSLTESRTMSFPDLTDLFTFFVEFVKPLPLKVFQQIIFLPITTENTLNIDAHTTLLEFILSRVLETTSSNLITFEPLTQNTLVEKYLPYAASRSSIDANARVSLCIEGLLRNLAKADIIRKNVTLENAVETGVKRRFDKVKEKKEKMKEGTDEEEAWRWLNGSSMRIRSVLKRLKP